MRVYDMPTSRCLSWLLFSSPVVSLAVSLSGEYLCVSQADKTGIFMYADRYRWTITYKQIVLVPNALKNTDKFSHA